MKFLKILLILFSLPLTAQLVILKDVNILDIENQKVIKNTSVLIKNGRIDKIAKFRRIKENESDSIVEGNGRFLMPGLIDTHIHFFQSGGLYTRPDGMDLREIRPYEDEIEFAKNNADDYLQRYLRSGITTVVDVGGPMWNFTIRDSIVRGMTSPNVLVTGPLFSMVDRPKLDLGDPPIVKVTTKEEVLALFNKQLPYNPDFIKVWYIVTPENPAEKTYPLVEYLGQLCKEHNLKLAVHALELETAQLAVKAGAKILVHGIEDQIIPVSFIKKLKEKKITYIPTLTALEGYLKTFTGKINHDPQDLANANPMAYGSILDPEHIDKKLWPSNLRNFYGKDPAIVLQKPDSITAINLAALSREGVNIATGTDAGNIGTMHASSYLPELKAMQEAGLNNWELLLYSTLNAAKGFGLADTLGTVNPGKIADLILLDKNPVEAIENLNSISLVIKSGKLLDPDSVLEETPEQLVQRQLNAYNARNIEAFLDTYAPDVKIYNEKNELIMDGHEAMRTSYSKLFESAPNLHYELKNRMVINNKVIDHEKVRFNDRYIHAVAVYEVENGKIVKVRFIR